ncbi:integrin alpha-E isoform X1 [Triplophysa dalaica]|uniref:integrin alpha-E isoform X1 n=1 Tax=Triplophysa dalaica TaxID=1582913 RepID=UPI0024DF80E2|nr:integrin alpha-E isoform X1 [Triplophysa dalaica]
MYQGVTLMIVICSGFIIQASPVTYFTTDDPTDRVLVPSQTTGRLLKCTGKNDCNLVGDVLKPEAAEEVKKTADAGKEIAFVLDGSASIQPDDFQRAKDFIYNVMSNVWETCFDCDFAVVQYGFDIKTELSLRDSDDRARALKKVQEIQQLGRVTKTASAIHHVLTNVFVPENGSKNNSRKIIIVLSDGEILGDPMNLTDVLNMPQMEEITQFAIGVGDNLKPEAVEEIKEMADTNKFFHVSNYTALHNILGQLEQSITRNAGTEISFVLDGSGSIQPDDFHRAKYFIYNVMLNVWKCVLM